MAVRVICPLALYGHLLMPALPPGPGWHQGVLLIAGAGNVGKNKVANIQDSGSVHGGGLQVGWLADPMLRLK